METQKTLPILKSEASEAKQVFYVVVAEPGVPDLQDDIWDETEIEKAAWGYQMNSRFMSDGHRKVDGKLVPAPAYPVETYIAPVDFKIGEQEVKKGSWVMAVKVNDAEVWQDVMEGRIDGVSIGGSGIRTPV